MSVSTKGQTGTSTRLTASRHLHRCSSISRSCTASEPLPVIECEESALEKWIPIEFVLWPAAGFADARSSLYGFLLELDGARMAWRRVPSPRVVKALDVIEHIGLGKP